MRARLAICVSLALAACSGDDSSFGGTNGAGAADGGGGSSGGGGVVYVPPKCHQTCQDYLTGHAVVDTVWFLYNQNIPGLPGGNVDVTGACPLGGTVHITGTATGSPEGTSTVHLVFDLAACRNSDARYSVTLQGVVNMDGNFDNGSVSGTQFTAVTFTSATLELGGELIFLDDPPLDETCPLAVKHQAGAETSTIDGEVCGREFSSDTALDDLGGGFVNASDGGTAGSNGSSGGGSSGSSGGGSSGTSGGGSGSGGGDCTCYCGWPAGQICQQNTDCPPDESLPGTSVPGVCGCPVGC